MKKHDDHIGVSGSNKGLESLEDEEAAGTDIQERRIESRRITFQSGYEQRDRDQLIQPISNLPNDVLYCVLDKLYELVDYVRLRAVSKELLSVANEYNHTEQRWLRKPQLLPMLMLPLTESDNGSDSEPQTRQRLVYSVSGRKFYNNINIGLSVPYHEKFYGSSQGWLASGHKSIEEDFLARKWKVTHGITLWDPFGKASEAIHLPPYIQYLPFWLMRSTIEDWIPRVILSANPALHPENYYVLLVFYRPLTHRVPVRWHENYSPPFALIKGGPESWVTIDLDEPLLADDAIFYKNKVCLLIEKAYAYYHNMVTVDVNSSNLSPQKIRFEPSYIPENHFWDRYLLESTDGDLLLVQTNPVKKKLYFSVFKIMFDEEGESKGKGMFQLVKIKCIGDNAIFLGQSQSQSVLASRIPGLQPNGIYYATEFYRLMEYPVYDHLKSETGIFNLGNRTTTPLFDSESIYNCNGIKMNMPLWILPSLKLEP